MLPAHIHHLLKLGDAARRSGSFSDAEAVYLAALEAATQGGVSVEGPDYGPQHLAAAEVCCKLGRLYESRRRYEEADECYARCLRIFSSVAGDEYFELALARDRTEVPEEPRWIAAA